MEQEELKKKLQEAQSALEQIQSLMNLSIGGMIYRKYTKPRLENDPEYRKRYLEYAKNYKKEHYDAAARREWRNKHKDRINAERRAKREAMTEEELMIQREKCRLYSAARRERERQKKAQLEVAA